MHELIGSLISNESKFGRIMTRCWVVIGGNLMFILFSLPVVTMGAGFAALSHVMFKALRGDGAINPIVQFWKGFRANFKQATIVWLITLVLIVFGYIDLRICSQAGGFVAGLRYGVYAVGLVLLIILIFLFPTMAAFSDTLPNLVRNSIYFAFHKPFKTLVILFFNVFPMILTYSDPQYFPLYGFIWAMFGFGAISLLTARLLLPEFEPYLPLVDEFGDFILDRNGRPLMPGDELDEEEQDMVAEALGTGEMSEEEVLEEMRKLGM